MSQLPAAPPTTILIHDAAVGWMQFAEPVEILTTRNLRALPELLTTVNRRVESEGLYAAGFLSYEAGWAFATKNETGGGAQSALTAPRHATPEATASTVLPLAWFALCQVRRAAQLPGTPSAPDFGWQPSVDRTEYDAAIADIHEHLGAGDCYQINYTYRLNAPMQGSTTDLFATLMQAQGPGYAAYIDTPEWTVMSASQELLLHDDGQTLTSKPMKGTAPRGRTPALDRRTRETTPGVAQGPGRKRDDHRHGA